MVSTQSSGHAYGVEYMLDASHRAQGMLFRSMKAFILV